MKNFRNTLTILLDSLKKNRLLEIQKEYIGVPVDEDLYNILITHHKLSLSDKLSEFYHLMSSCKIEWTCDLTKHNIKKYSDDDTLINGLINIRPMEEMLEFDKKLGAEWWTKNLSGAEEQDLYNFRYFDNNDDYTRVGFIRNQNNEIKEKLYFIVQESSGFLPVNLTFEEYLDKIIEYKGFQGWQYNYFFPDSVNYERMMFYLNQLFK